MTQGLTGGAVAAVVAVLVSLPLHSPNDGLFNTLFLAIGALLVGLAASVIWLIVAGRRNPQASFLVLWAVAFAAAIGIVFAMSTQLGPGHLLWHPHRRYRLRHNRRLSEA